MKIDQLTDALETLLDGIRSGERYGKEILDRGIDLGKKYGRVALDRGVDFGRKYGKEAVGIIYASPERLKKAVAAVPPAVKKASAAKTVLRVAGIAAGTAAVASLGAYYMGKVLAETAFAREAPQIVQKLSGRVLPKGEDLVRQRAMEDGMQKLLESRPEAVYINSFDGTPLVGHFLPCENAERVVILMHGWRSHWYHDFSLSWEFLKNNRCSLFFAEQRACGDSGGEYMSLGLNERYDCREWIKWVVGRCGEDTPIYLCGISMGAATVMMASGLDLPANVRGVIADCGFTSPSAICKWVAINRMHVGYGLPGMIAEDIVCKKIQNDSLKYSSADALRVTKKPVLFIHGSDDTLVPVEMTYENYKACASPKRLLIVPGAEHGLSYYVDKASYEAAVLDFFKDFDK